MESFSALKNLARVSAGLKERGPFYARNLPPQKMTFVEGWPASVKEKLNAHTIKQGKPGDPWNVTRN